MKIAIVTRGELPVPNVKGGGAETLITALLDENEKYNNRITVFSVWDERAEIVSKKYKNTDFVFMPNKKRTFFDRVRTRVLNDFPRESPYSFSRVKNIIKNGDYDRIIIEHSPWQFPYFVKEFGEKVFLHLHNDWVNGDLEDIYKKRYEKAIRYSGGVIAVSQFLKNKILTVGNVDNSKIKVLYNATNIEKFAKKIEPEHIKNLKRELGIKEEDIVIVYSGRLCKEKGVLELIKAFENIVKTNNKVKLVIIGSVSYGETTADGYTKKIEDEVNRNEGKIIVTGFVDYDTIPLYYQIGDIQVIPSIWDEPFGLVAIEGAASGLPIVSTDTGGLKEIFNDYYGRIIKKDNIVHDLEVSINELVQQKELRAEYKEKSSQLIQKHSEYCYRSYYKNFLEIINNKKRN